ncbi:MAG: Rrf2 family transcriptional regulator [Ancalomicrobiaceae bacterium]|nr:Rrf2 family transcriptional regulator [Ancalomicrobiaceae bacterium]
MLTKKGKYGLKAMIHLARIEPGTVAMVADIATTNNISKKFLDSILLDLRNAGFLKSKKGPGGGYSLAKPAEEILIGPIIRVLDGPLAPIACASRTAFQPCDDCVDLTACGVRLIMSDVRDAMAAILDRTTLASLVAREDGVDLAEAAHG